MTDYPNIRAHLKAVRDNSLAKAEEVLAHPTSWTATQVEVSLRTAEAAQRRLEVWELQDA